MEIIQDLVDLVSRNKLKSIELLGQAEQGRVSTVFMSKLLRGSFARMKRLPNTILVPHLMIMPTANSKTSSKTA